MNAQIHNVMIDWLLKVLHAVYEVVHICNSAPFSVLCLCYIHKVAEQPLVVIKDKLYHPLQGNMDKLPTLLPSVPINVAIGNEWVKKQTEIITDQTI